jgi:hypothetical protein
MTNKRKPNWALIAALTIPLSLVLLVAAFVAYVAWEAFGTHVYNPAGASTGADVARFTSVPPPPEARDFRVASFRYGQAGLNFVRFSAPAEVCRKYAATVMPNAAFTPVSRNQKYDDLMALYMAANWLGDLRWFDLPYARNIWTLQRGLTGATMPQIDIPEAPDIVGADANTEKKGYLTTSVRIDLSRGVFYFLQVN